jgi:hypothetical protein
MSQILVQGLLVRDIELVIGKITKRTSWSIEIGPWQTPPTTVVKWRIVFCHDGYARSIFSHAETHQGGHRRNDKRALAKAIDCPQARLPRDSKE